MKVSAAGTSPRPNRERPAPTRRRRPRGDRDRGGRRRRVRGRRRATARAVAAPRRAVGRRGAAGHRRLRRPGRPADRAAERAWSCGWRSRSAHGAVNAATVQLGGVGGAAAGLRRTAHRGHLGRDPRRDRRAASPSRAAPPTRWPGRSAASCSPGSRSARPDGRTGHQPARFIGIDGPRWFLRAVFHGRAVHDAEAAERAGVGGPRRGGRPRSRCDGPARAAPAAPAGRRRRAAGAEEPGQERTRDDLAPFERGPEITEIR